MALYMTCVYITNIQAFKDALFHHSLKEVSQARSSIKLVATTHCWTYATGREGFWVKLEMKNTTSQAYCDQAFKDALFHHSLKEVSQASSSIKLVATTRFFHTQYLPSKALYVQQKTLYHIVIGIIASTKLSACRKIL